MIAFAVHGVPAPQGSKTRMPNGAMLEAGSATGRQKVKSWRADVRQAAEDWCTAEGDPPLLLGPVELDIAFAMPRPKSRKKEFWVATKPDLSKLVRATEDALTGVIWKDDSQVVILRASMFYSDPLARPGASIRIRENP